MEIVSKDLFSVCDPYERIIYGKEVTQYLVRDKFENQNQSEHSGYLKVRYFDKKKWDIQ